MIPVPIVQVGMGIIITFPGLASVMVDLGTIDFISVIRYFFAEQNPNKAFSK